MGRINRFIQRCKLKIDFGRKVDSLLNPCQHLHSPSSPCYSGLLALLRLTFCTSHGPALHIFTFRHLFTPFTSLQLNFCYLPFLFLFFSFCSHFPLHIALPSTFPILPQIFPLDLRSKAFAATFRATRALINYRLHSSERSWLNTCTSCTYSYPGRKSKNVQFQLVSIMADVDVWWPVLCFYYSARYRSSPSWSRS